MATRSVPRAASAVAGIVFVAAALAAGCASTPSPRAKYGDAATCGPLALEAYSSPAVTRAGVGKLQMGPGAVAVDGARPAYRTYVETLRERIRLKWRSPGAAVADRTQGDVTLDLFIARDGRLEHVQLAESSGAQALDDAAVLAVKSAQPFPPVPEDVCRQTLGLTMDFWYQLK